MNNWKLLLGLSALASIGLVTKRIHSDTNGWRRQENGSDYDVIAVHGAGYQKVNGEYEVTDRAQMRLNGALGLYENSPEAMLILCGGDVYDKGISEAEVMRRYLLENGISPEANMELVENTLDTSGNVERTIELGNSGKTAVLTNHENVPRTQRLFRNFGLPEADVYSSELACSESPNYKQNLGLYLFPELPFYLLLMIDPKGKIPRHLAKMRRGEDAISVQKMEEN